jgi:DGQHR domain-containing protein
MKIKDFITISQPIGTFYVFKMNPHDLVKICKSNLREIKADAQLGEQRILDSKRQKEIKSYIHKNPIATFPTNIVLSTEKSGVRIDDDGFLNVDINKSLSILDGQHRISGFENNREYSDFELIISLFAFDNQSLKSEVFKIINSKQTTVSPSLRHELEQDSELNTPEKFIVELAKLLNYSSDSILKNKIEFYNQKSKKPITYAAFHRELIRFVYSDIDYNEIRYYLTNESTQEEAVSQYLLNNKITNKHVLWKFYSNYDLMGLYKIINDYFRAVKFVFTKDWDDKNSFILKSIGFRVLIIIFTDIIAIQDSNFTYDYFEEKIMKLASLNGKLNSSNFSASSYGDAATLVEIFNNILKK